LLKVSPSTISRELKRNSNNSYYDPEQAHIQAVRRDKFKVRYKKLTNKIKLEIGKLLRLGDSPEQLVGKLKKDKIANISHETVYRYIYANQKSGGKLYKYLRHKNKKYGNRSSEYKTRGQIKNRINIDKRPKIVDKKARFGDFEVDTIIGKDHKGVITGNFLLRKTAFASFVTLVDRKSKGSGKL